MHAIAIEGYLEMHCTTETEAVHEMGDTMDDLGLDGEEWMQIQIPQHEEG